MTVITKPLTDKKSNKLKEPLVENAEVQSGTQNQDVEAGDEPRYVILGARAQRVSTATTVCLFLTALLVMSIGIIGGVYLYRQFARSQMHRFHGWCNIPLTGNKMYVGDEEDQAHHDSLLGDSRLFPSLSHRKENTVDSLAEIRDANNFLKQEFELDLESDKYEKINVPDFGGGRRGRFIHDFNANKTGIIDLDGRRCFVMPLDRQKVWPPRSMYDLIRKMWDGYYEVDTEVVRETMRVVLPPVTDFTDIGQYITRECKYLRTYMLEKQRNGISKRSASANQLQFTEFAGKKISKFSIDLDAVEQYEKNEESRKP